MSAEAGYVFRADDTLAAVRAIANALEEAPFVIERSDQRTYVISSRRNAPLVIDEVVNRDAFVHLAFDTPRIMTGRQSVEFLAVGGWQSGMPPEMILRVSGRAEPLCVPMPR